jgi:hypothetical protein
MATDRYIIAKGDRRITFTVNSEDRNVVVTDSDDSLPCTESRKQALETYAAFIDQGFKSVDGRHPKSYVPKAAPAAAPKPAAVAASNRTAAKTAARIESRQSRGSIMPSNDTVDSMEQRVQTLKRTVEESGKEYVDLSYDIPTSKNSEVGNPSRMLWKYGFRRQLSCWTMPKHNLEAPEIKDLIAEYEAQGITVDVIVFAEHQMEVVRKIAARKLDEQVRDIHTSLINAIITADEALKKAQEKEAAEKAGTSEEDTESKSAVVTVARRNQRVRSSLRKAVEDFQNAVHCAELFDQSENLADLFAGIRSAIMAAREAFNAQMREQGSMLLAETL